MVSDETRSMTAEWQQAEPQAPRSARYRPWLWPSRLLWRLGRGVSPGLWLANYFFQRVLRINGNVPWPVHFTSYVTGRIRIGRNVWKSFAVSGGCYIQGGNGIEIGHDSIFAPGIKIISANHAREEYSRWLPAPPIRIGQRCWIGTNAVILPGVQLDDDVIVGAGAVVAKSFSSGSVLVGVPARSLDQRGAPPNERVDAPVALDCH